MVLERQWEDKRTVEHLDEVLVIFFFSQHNSSRKQKNEQDPMLRMYFICFAMPLLANYNTHAIQTTSTTASVKSK